MFLKITEYLLNLLTLIIGIPFLLWVAGFIVFTGTICAMHEPRTPSKVDAAIVLTGGTNRVNKGLDLLATNKTSNLLVSGVHKNVEIRDIMSLWGDHKDAPPCCITLGYEAGNTIGNAQEAKKWVEHIDARTIYVITANYHMPRALLEFHHVLKDAAIRPYPVQPENFDPKERIFWKTAFLEYHKTVMTLIRIIFYPNETKPVPDALTQ